MARPTRSPAVQQVSGNPVVAGSAAVYRQHRKANPKTDRNQIAKPWQIEAYRQVNICGEARYSATLFAAMAGRAEIGISDAQALSGKANWINTGDEVDTLAELAPTVRERSKLIRDYMLHYIIAGECYLIARERVDTDPGYIQPPVGFDTWDEYLRETVSVVDVLDPDFDPDTLVTENPNVTNPIWEIVAVTELQKIGTGSGQQWRVRHDNENWINLKTDDPVIRMWNPDPEDRREAWSPFRSLLPTLKEIEWLTKHIFTQVRSRLMSAGVWFLPDNLTFPPPPPDAVEGGAEAIAKLNEAEQFMLSLAAISEQVLDGDEISMPAVVMASELALAQVEQDKLIKFWSEIDDKAMILRSDAVRRFALGMDLPPEQVLGSSGLAVTGAGGSAGSVNHWGVWANEEQTISAHIEPALDNFVGTLTAAFLRSVHPDTEYVIAYDTATLRLRQDRSKESIELWDRGLLKGEIVLRETGFDPQKDKMDAEEHKIWLLGKLVSGTPTPEQMQVAFALLTGDSLPVPTPETGGSGDDSGEAKDVRGLDKPPTLEDHPYEGPPREQHDHSPAPYSAQLGVVEAQAEVLVLRALEKAGNRVLNAGKRGRDRDRNTPAHLAHVVERPTEVPEFDFSLAPTVYGDLSAAQRDETERQLRGLCADLYETGTPYTRAALLSALKGS